MSGCCELYAEKHVLVAGEELKTRACFNTLYKILSRKAVLKIENIDGRIVIYFDLELKDSCQDVMLKIPSSLGRGYYYAVLTPPFDQSIVLCKTSLYIINVLGFKVHALSPPIAGGELATGYTRKA